MGTERKLMSSRKILITGGSGQLGTECAEVLGRVSEVKALGSRDLDITHAVEVKRCVEGHRPQVILNCAAYTQVDACETERELAWRVNVVGPRNLAEAARTFGATLVHISTDYVFDGKREPPLPYVEGDETHPLSYYGETKWTGEEVIRAICDKHMIVRTGWTYGANGQNFFKAILRLAMDGRKRPIRVVNDQFGSPTWAYRLAVQIERIIGEGDSGTYHATAEGFCTRYESAVEFLSAMEIPQTIVPCSTEEYPTAAKRPRNSILENRRLKEMGANLKESWVEDLHRFVFQYKGHLIREAREASL